MNNSYTVSLSNVRRADTLTVGGKGANLGEMISAGFPVPGGFAVTAHAYREFLVKNKLTDRIKDILNPLDVNDSKRLNLASEQVQKLITHSPVPAEMAGQIIRAYLDLRKPGVLFTRDQTVAVRSSATAEDSKTASFAGQNETFLNIRGEANLVEAVRRCWASLFTPRSIFYRVQQKIDHFSSAIAVIVQIMVPSEVSGIIFSVDPVTGNKNRIVIEAIWGLGEYIVQGKVTPDHYEVNKSDFKIMERQFVSQRIMLSRGRNNQNQEKPVPLFKKGRRKLADDQIQGLAKLSLALEEHYYFPQDSEFAVSDNKIYLVQTRPITTISSNRKQDTTETKDEEEALKKMEVLLTGAPASPGIVSGPVRILLAATEIDKISAGDILVAAQTNPDYVPAMKKAAAIVTDRGGRTSHAAIVSRELGIPCVVGTEKATKILRNGEVITVNGAQGKVYRGGLSSKPKPIGQISPISQIEKNLKTTTKVYVNLAEPERAKEIAALNCDGVGLLRAEFMLAGIGLHPKKVLANRTQKVFIQKLASQIGTFAQAFYPRPVVYRATDFKTNEYRRLAGGEKYELTEENPMIGFRGAYRYIIQPEVFQMEIEALKIVREQMGFRNLWLMIPFCRTVKELEQVKSLLHNFGMQRSPTFKLWLMCEIPANVILLDKFIETGIDGISVGSNDLTMLTLGVDRDNETVASEYNERDEALLWSFEKIIKTCRQYDVTCSICGQAPSDFPDLTEKLVKWGITSVSVNADVIDKTKQIVSEAEKKLHEN